MLNPSLCNYSWKENTSSNGEGKMKKEKSEKTNKRGDDKRPADGECED